MIPPSLSGSEGSNVYKSSWHCLEMMTFVRDEVECEKTTGNLRCQLDNDVFESSETQLSEPRSQASTQSSASTSTAKKRYTNHEDLCEIERRKLQLIVRQMGINIDKNYDYHYFMSLWPQIRQFSSLQKMKICQKISLIIIYKAPTSSTPSYSSYEYPRGFNTL